VKAWIDIKVALRQLYKAPKFTVLTLFVLIGGLSISLFTFSFMYSMVYADLPIPEGESALRVVVWEGGDVNEVPAYEFFEVRDQLTHVIELGAYQDATVRFSIGSEGKSLFTNYVEPNLFSFSRVQPILGRVLREEDQVAGAEPVAVVSHDTWLNELQGVDDIIGSSIRLNHIPTTVVGVMPEGYQFPGFARVWLPLPDVMSRLPAESQQDVKVYARLTPGSTLMRAEQELTDAINPLYQQGVQLYDKWDMQFTIRLMSFPMAQTDGGGPLVFTAFNMVAFCILLLACINVGNLLLARSIERQKETAIRAALGAPTRRLICQLMWEGVLITAIGVVLSLLLVGAALDLTDLVMRSNLGLAFWWQWGMDWPTLIMALVFGALTIFLASFLPAWRATRGNINSTLRDGTRGAQGIKAGRLSRLLVTVQVFLIAILMLVGSMSAFISETLNNMDTGENREQVIRADVTLPDESYPETSQRIAFFQSLTQRLKQDPQVIDAMVRQYRGKVTLRLDATGDASDVQQPRVDAITVMGNTEFYGTTLAQGRHLDDQDHANARLTALISQSMARRYWPDESPLEKGFEFELDDETSRVTVVGVVSNRMNSSSMFSPLDAEDEIYLSGFQFHGDSQDVFFKHIDDVGVAEERFFQTLYSLDPSVKAPRVEPADERLNIMRKMTTVTSDVTFGAGAFSLLLALTGIYGLTANSVAQRTHEIGIRRAVGASDRRIIRMFLRQGGIQLGIGLGLALIGFVLISILFHNFTQGLFPAQLYVWLSLIVIVGLPAVVMAAIYVPTRRAVNLEPWTALRHE